jgi:FdhE protein
MTTRILEPGEIEQRSTTIPELLLPELPGLFAARAARLRTLAEGNAIGAYLGFLARLSEAQQWVADTLPLPDVAGPMQREQARRAGMPLLPALAASRPEGWFEVLRAMLDRLAQGALPPGLHERLSVLKQRDRAWLDHQAAHILSGEYAALDLATAPLVAASLQVIWTASAAALTVTNVAPLVERRLCPVCGSHPVASVVRIGADVSGYRYLHCALCNTEWHVVRVKCSSCESTKGIDYREIDGGPGVVKAECCGECRGYLKQFYQEKAPELDPVADDLASLALDLLLDEEGFTRSGTNLLLFPAQA